MKCIEIKIYPNKTQATELLRWMRTCCKIYNLALDHRIKAYKRRRESISLYDQQAMLTKYRIASSEIRSVPAVFERDALHRLAHAMEAFFRRLGSMENPGFPRFRSWRQYNSIGYLETRRYIKKGNRVFIPCLGLIKYRGGKQEIPEIQKLLRVIRRPSGWYAQVVFDDTSPKLALSDNGPIGIDVGLESFATYSDGTKIENPRFAQKSARKLRSLQRRASRKMKGSKNRRKAVRRLARHHEKVAAQRKSFCHEHSTRIVRNHSLIAVEKLNVAGMARSRFSKSIKDAGWGMFLSQLKYKAANASRKLIEVDARYTSQTCPECGNVKKKELSERVHACKCGCILDRDVAAAKVILSRALDGNRGVTPVEEPTSAKPLKLAA